MDGGDRVLLERGGWTPLSLSEFRLSRTPDGSSKRRAASSRSNPHFLWRTFNFHLPTSTVYGRCVPAVISIIVPVFNEEDNILPMLREVAAALVNEPRPYEIVFVDDASRDRTWSRIQEAHQSDARVRGVRHEENRGQSAAVWTGIQSSVGLILVTLDGDLQNDPADLPKLLGELENVDFVCGLRINRRDNWVRRVSSDIARRARRAALGGNFRDTGCGYRAFRRSAIDGVLPFNGWHRFLPILVHGSGVTTKEIPIGHRPRAAGVSKYGVLDRLGRGIVDLIGVAWYQKRRLRPVKTISHPQGSSDYDRSVLRHEG